MMRKQNVMRFESRLRWRIIVGEMRRAIDTLSCVMGAALKTEHEKHIRATEDGLL